MNDITTFNILKEVEGFESKPYPDPLTNAEPYTFGYGFTYLTREEADAVLKIRMYSILNQLKDKYEWFENISELRQMVVINMVYQIGFNGFSNFKNTIKYIANKDFDNASIEMLDSNWQRQMHDLDMINGVDGENRAEWLAWIMKHNVYRKRESK